jgi:hypothetical protein
MMLLLDVWRKLKLLRDDAAEHLQRLSTILWTKNFPEAIQCYPSAWCRFLRKKAPSWLSRMCFLLEFGGWRRTNRRASKKQKQTIRESLAISQRTSVCVSYVCCFWGDQAHLDKFLQMYAVERAKLEARKKGYAVNEQALNDGSIKLQIIEGAKQ